MKMPNMTHIPWHKKTARQKGLTIAAYVLIAVEFLLLFLHAPIPRETYLYGFLLCLVLVLMAQMK
ncbi:MAG: hypothetical protein Q4C54_01605 [Clostridia bacterium]|nr:hypothetical protein [Clostridia bacterium]